MTEREPAATVVVPVRDERAGIRACLESIQAQTEQRLQILVVDGASEDGTRDVVRAAAAEDPRIRLVDNPGRTAPFALNRGLEQARAKVLVRVDGHSTIPPTYVARALELLETGPWGGVGGVKRGVGRTASGVAIARAMSSRFGVGGSLYHYGTSPCEVEHVPFGVYRVDLARELGGWAEEFTVNQDFEFDHRLRTAGHRLLFHPDLVIDWECRQSILELFSQYRRYGRGKVKVAFRHPDSIRPRHTVPPAFVAGLAATGLAALTGPRGRRAAMAALAPYGLGLTVATIRSASTVEAAALPRVPMALVAMHVGWGLGFWSGLIDRYRSRPAGRR